MSGERLHNSLNLIINLNKLPFPGKRWIMGGFLNNLYKSAYLTHIFKDVLPTWVII